MQRGTFTVKTGTAMELIDITTTVAAAMGEAGVREGVCYLFNPHTTAGLTINEGADPDVRTDIIAGLRKIVPMNHPFRHAEGNSPAHIMASLMGPSLTVFMENGYLLLGTWQKIYFCEFDGPRTRKVHWRMYSHETRPE